MEGGEILTQLPTASALEKREYGSGEFNESMGKDNCDDVQSLHPEDVDF